MRIVVPALNLTYKRITMQKFYASKILEKWTNGAIGYGHNSPMDCIGPYAKIKNCPINGIEKRLTCYATGYADTFFSIPACTRYKGKYIKGYISGTENGPEFHVMDSHKHFFN